MQDVCCIVAFEYLELGYSCVWRKSNLSNFFSVSVGLHFFGLNCNFQLHHKFVLPDMRKHVSLTALFIFVLAVFTQAQTTSWPLKYGKYNCTASKYQNGSYEYIPRGSFTIAKNGSYIYYGLKKPSSGKFKIDKDGNLLFTGGYLDKGKAEKIDRPNKFFVVFPTIPDNRWTCSCVE